MKKYLLLYLLLLNCIFANEKENLFEILDTGNIEYIVSSIAQISDINIENSVGETPLLYILENANNKEEKFTLVKLLIEKGANVNSVNSAGDTALTIALRQLYNGNDEREIVKLLIKNGDSVLKYQNLKLNELSISSIFNDFNKAKSLIENGEDINCIDEKIGMTPLMLASIFNSKEVAELLIKNGAKLEIPGEYKTQALHYAVEYNSKEIMELLIKNGANLESEDGGGATPLIWAAMKNNKEVAELLIKSGANLVAKGEFGDTPIHYAAQWNSKEILALLIKNGVDPEIKGENGNTALSYAMQLDNFGSKDVLEFLVKIGVNPTPIFDYVIINNNLEIIRFLLIEKGLTINFKSSEASILLKMCLDNNELELANILIKQGVDLEHYNYNRELLRKSVVLGKNDLLKFLLNKGVNPSDKNEKGDFPLLFAAMFDNDEAVRILLENGANLEMKNNNLKDSFYVAVEENSINVVSFLVKKGVNVNKKYDKDVTPLHIAARNGSFEVTKLLIEKGANVNAIDKYKWTPLMDAAIGDCSDSEGDSYFPNNKNNKNYEIAELLIEKGANVNAKSEIGTALKNTIGANGEGKAYKMAKLLIEKGCSLDNVNGMVSASYLIRLVGSDGFINLKLPSKYKIDYSDKIHSKEQYFNTALVKAISDKDISLIKYLIENGADINITNENGDTALLEAIKTKNLEILEYILSQNPKFNIINKQGADIFIKASGEKKILELLIKYSFNVDNPQNNINKQFIYAIILNDLEKVKKLINKVTDITKLSIEGKTPLIFATENNSLEVLKFLYIRNLDTIENELLDKNGKSIIAYAVENKAIESLKYLLNSGLDLSFEDYLLKNLVFDENYDLVNLLIHSDLYKNNNNQISSALFSAQTKEMMSLLLENGGNIKFIEYDDVTLLEESVRFDRDIRLIEYLLKSNQFNDEEKLKALILAINEGKTEITKLFVNNDVNISDINVNDLDINWYSDNPEFINYFKKYIIKNFDFSDYITEYDITDEFDGMEGTYAISGRALNLAIIHKNKELIKLLMDNRVFSKKEINEAVFLSYYGSIYVENDKEVIKLIEAMKSEMEENSSKEDYNNKPEGKTPMDLTLDAIFD